jgi:choline dehydrogenase-like flavoprotein
VSAGEILHGRHLGDRFEAECDVLVVGSGAGGSVIATTLAEAGKRVIVLEEGPHYRPEQINRMRPTEVMRRLWREAGMLSAVGVGQTPILAVTVGRNVGGSSVHTGGVCFRVPGSIHREWDREHGMPELSEKAFEKAYEEVERRMQVEEVLPAARSGSTARFVEGARALGVEMHNLRRNTHGCEGNARCNFGCPRLAKQSVDISYLPTAVAHGATIIADALVERVLFEGDRAAGVEGVFLGGHPVTRSTTKKPFSIRAGTVVIAGGTLHSPLLLMESGIGSKHLGRHITLHPSVRVGAIFPDRMAGWDGALQSVYSDHYEREGITLVGVYTPVNVLAAGFPGVGPGHRRYVQQMPNFGVFGGLVHDEGGGVLRPPVIGREGLLTYDMAPRDLLRMRRTMTILGEMAFAAGATEVHLPVFGSPAMKDVTTLRTFEHEPLDPRRIESVSFHPLGSARMANDPRRGVVAPSGEVYGTRELYVADGSVLPSSIGVNSQEPIMAMATRIAWGLCDRLATKSSRSPGAKAHAAEVHP